MAELLAGKVIVVAGAGGIANVLARRYADEGARVVALTEHRTFLVEQFSYVSR